MVYSLDILSIKDWELGSTILGVMYKNNDTSSMPLLRSCSLRFSALVANADSSIEYPLKEGRFNEQFRN